MSASASSLTPAAAAGSARVVHHADALVWLQANAPLRDASVVTSLPDTSELPHLAFNDWQRWFQDAAALVMGAVPDQGVAIFFQSDIRHAGLWVDKGALVARAAEQAGMGLLFHKIVCRKPPGTITFRRAGYAHLLGFARALHPGAGNANSRHASPDVIADGGFKPGVKAMGAGACALACRFILAETPTRTVVDPFCGFGTVLAVANALGLSAVGVDISTRMCRRARALTIDLNDAVAR